MSMATTILIPGLPNELALDILARIPRQYHAILSSVSKSIRSVISSSQLFAIRSQLNFTENLLYFKVRFAFIDTNEWFAIYKNLDRLQFARIQANPSKLTGSAYAAMGPNIYAIGGRVNEHLCSSDVWILDCRSHTWHRGPSMRIPRSEASIAIVRNKIYVIGGMKNETLVEVYDTLIEQWEIVLSPYDDDSRKRSLKVLDTVDDRFIVIWDMLSCQVHRLDIETKKWEKSKNLVAYHRTKNDCIVDGVSYDNGVNAYQEICFYDSKKKMWKPIKGVLERKNIMFSKLVNLNERLVVMWAEIVREKYVELWCSEIDITKNRDGNLLGREVGKFPLHPQKASHLTLRSLYEQRSYGFCFNVQTFSVTL
ncbi:hypothetical protein F8388_008228 [Cannabis sativa]|uniref:F-box domain-containing protein n=2 Tax=Cannabis sativa TaxID=3483 RepID=A0A7J6EV90_CANSA|nr:hypothetical protein F8388_008228 [Cannabis sativa]KAF4391335.1 hypothetical protein G4B88_016645 [Cannabis sativa]